MVLYRALETEGLSTARTIYDYMTSQGIKPNQEAMLTIFRGFRLAGMEDRCFQVLEIMKKNNWKIREEIGTELLTLVSSKYDPAVVLIYYERLFPLGYGFLDDLGIQQYMSKRGISATDVLQPDHLPESEHVESPVYRLQKTIAEAPLNAVYGSVLNSVQDLQTISDLYIKYKAFVVDNKRYFTTPISMKVLDNFVITLCSRFGTAQAIELAHGIFVDAVTHIRFTCSRRLHNSCLALGQLSFHHSNITNDSYINSNNTNKDKNKNNNSSNSSNNVGKAIELVKLTENYDFLPITKQLFNPIIKHYLFKGQINEARYWADYAQNVGIIIDDNVILRNLNL